MTATLKRLDPTQVELEVAVSPDDFERAREIAFRALAKNARVPGFRPGKVPRRIFEAQYGTGAIDERAIDSLVPDAYAKALDEHDLDPVARPEMELLPATEESPLRFKATVTVRPEIALGTYKGIEVTDEVPPISDEDVEKAIESLRRDAAQLVPVERPVQLGDVATLDYEGKIDGVPFEGGKAEGQPTEIDASRFIPGFAEGIVGMTAGETKDVHAKFPEGYGQAELAGKDAVFTITVHDVKEPELPALDDEFAKRVSNEETMEALRADVRRRLEEMRESRARRALSEQLLDKLADAHDFPLPALLVDNETEGLLEETKAYVARYGRTWEDELKERGKTEDEIRAELRVEAEKRVKRSLLLAEIAKAEGITANDADIDRELTLLARQYGQPKERILEALRPNIASLIDGIVRTKTLDVLVDSATITGATNASEA